VDPKRGGSFPWLSFKEEGHFLGHVQRRRVIPLAVPKVDWLFPWLSPKVKDHFFGYAKGIGLFPWLYPIENGHSLGHSQERWWHSLIRAQ